MIYMQFLKWVGFALISYTPYISNQKYNKPSKQHNLVGIVNFNHKSPQGVLKLWRFAENILIIPSIRG
jgi:hypothetical protein